MQTRLLSQTTADLDRYYVEESKKNWLSREICNLIRIIGPPPLA